MLQRLHHKWLSQVTMGKYELQVLKPVKAAQPAWRESTKASREPLMIMQMRDMMRRWKSRLRCKTANCFRRISHGVRIPYGPQKVVGMFSCLLCTNRFASKHHTYRMTFQLQSIPQLNRNMNSHVSFSNNGQKLVLLLNPTCMLTVPQFRDSSDRC